VIGANGRDGAAGASGAPGASVRSTSVEAVNGEGGTPNAELIAGFAGGSARGRVAYGKSVLVSGKLVTPSGRPIRDAVIDVVATPSLKGARPVAGRPVVTGPDGSFTYRADGVGGSRSLTFAYRYQREGAVAVQRSVALTVRAGVRLSVKLRGVVASYSGRVLAGSMPRGGKLVIVQGRAKGGSWQTFASRRAGRTGAFKGKYRLKVRRPGKQLQFRVRVIGESGWNYAAVTSKAVTRRVK
jgi:hypothetical protein